MVAPSYPPDRMGQTCPPQIIVRQTVRLHRRSLDGELPDPTWWAPSRLAAWRQLRSGNNSSGPARFVRPLGVGALANQGE